MFEELSEFLKLAVGEDAASEILSAAETLVEFGYTAHVAAFTDLLSMGENQEIASTTDSIRDQLDNAYRQVFRAMGISLTDEAIPLNVLYNTLFALGQFDKYEDKAYIKVLFEDNSPEEALCEYVELLGNINWADVLPFIKSVSTGLVERLMTICDEAESQQLNTVPVKDVRVQQERLSIYLQKYQDLLISEALENGIPLGLPFERVLEPYIDRLEPLSPPAAAKELVGLALASEVETEGLTQALMQEIERIYSDINHITKVNVAVAEILREVGHAQA